MNVKKDIIGLWTAAGIQLDLWIFINESVAITKFSSLNQLTSTESTANYLTTHTEMKLSSLNASFLWTGQWWG